MQAGGCGSGLRVELLAGPGAAEVADLLRGHDGAGLVTVAVVDRPGVAALVIGVHRGGVDEGAAEVVLDPDVDLPGQVDRLWSERLAPFAQRFAGLVPAQFGPPVLGAHDPRLAVAARRLLDRLRTGLLAAGLDDGHWTYDHIGSTAVPGLRAKRFVDLQVGVAPLPAAAAGFDDVVAAVGYRPAGGARPDSPGVHRDLVKDPDLAPPEVYRKRVFVRADPPQPSILHVRQRASPWWAYTVRFRDWLRADPAARRAYEQMKHRAALAHAHDVDADDYTRAKMAFFDRVHRRYQEFDAR